MQRPATCCELWWKRRRGNRCNLCASRRLTAQRPTTPTRLRRPTRWPRFTGSARRIGPSSSPRQHGRVVGYAYATQFRDRAAYAWTCENSIYVHPDWQGRGVGKALLEHLCEKAQEFGFRQMIGVIGGAEEASVRLHASCGFREVGRLARRRLEARSLARQCLHAASAGGRVVRAA